jgi:ABC-2 type transport system permease protein
MQTTVFAGAFTYEFRMQVRRPMLWIVMSLTTLLLVGFASRTPGVLDLVTSLQGVPILESVVSWTNLINYVLPIAACTCVR